MRISTASIASTANRSSTDPYTCGTPHSTARALARSRLESQRATTSHRACPRYPGTFRAPTLPTPIIPIRTFSKGAPQATKWLANRKRAMKLVALTSGCWRSWGRQPIRWRRLGGRFFAKPSREQASVCFIDAQLTRSPFLRVPSCLSRSKSSLLSAIAAYTSVDRVRQLTYYTSALSRSSQQRRRTTAMVSSTRVSVEVCC